MIECYAKWIGTGLVPLAESDGLLDGLTFGEVVRVEVYSTRQRSTKMHRRHFALLNYLYRFVHDRMSFHAFRQWMTIGAGYFEAAPNGDLCARSIAFRNMDETEFRALHSRTITYAAEQFLPDSVSREDVESAVEILLLEFA